MPGFGIKVTPTGAKIYVLQYRMGGRGTKTKRYTLGKEGALRAQSARKLAEGLYGEIKNGKDIAGAKREANEATRAATELAFNRERREWYLPAKRAKNGCENIIPLTDRAVAKLDRLAGGHMWPKSGLL